MTTTIGSTFTGGPPSSYGSNTGTWSPIYQPRDSTSAPAVYNPSKATYGAWFSANISVCKVGSEFWVLLVPPSSLVGDCVAQRLYLFGYPLMILLHKADSFIKALLFVGDRRRAIVPVSDVEQAVCKYSFKHEYGVLVFDNKDWFDVDGAGWLVVDTDSVHSFSLEEEDCGDIFRAFTRSVRRNQAVEGAGNQV